MNGDDSLREDVFLDHVRQACLEESNRICVSPTRTKISKLANQIAHGYVYLVIIIPDHEHHQSSECFMSGAEVLPCSPPPPPQSDAPELHLLSPTPQMDASDQARTCVSIHGSAAPCASTAPDEISIRLPNMIRSSGEDEEEDDSDDSTEVLPFEMEMEEWLSLGRGSRMKKWYDAQKIAEHDQVSILLYPTKVLLTKLSQCTLCAKAKTFCVGKTNSTNGKCLHCIHRKQACSMARHVNKGRPRKSGLSSRSAPKKAPEQATIDDVVPSRTMKRKNTSERPGTTKRVKSTYMNPSSSHQSVVAPPHQPSNDEFESALRLIALIKDAISAAEAEIRRQQARGAAAPSHAEAEICRQQACGAAAPSYADVGALLALLLPSKCANQKGKGKERSKK